MITNRLVDIAETTVQRALKAKVDQAQAAAFFVDSALTRFANSQVHQNVASKKGGVAIKVVINQKVGTVRVNSLAPPQIKEAVNQAVTIAKVTPPNTDFKSLPPPRPWTPIEGTFDKTTAQCTPERRADAVKAAIDTAHATSPRVTAVAGSLSTGAFTFAIANSLDVAAWAQISLASLQTTVIAQAKGSHGYGSAEQHARNIAALAPATISREAADNAVNSLHPKQIPIGEYEAVLSPRAAAALFMYLGYIGFSATSYQDGQSFVKYNLNKQVFDARLSVKDDPCDPTTLYAFPIDGEGVPKKMLPLIEHGTVSTASICHNAFTAGKEKDQLSTGHALPPIFGFYGRPLPYNIVVAAGEATVDEMVSETRHGIFITRFHYTNPVEPTKAILTGLTRDGTFLIEDGEITAPVRNLRYTDSMLSALKVIPLLGRARAIVEDVTTPAMKLEKLRFTGITEH
jgi:predicted Zn-dependent protease